MQVIILLVYKLFDLLYFCNCASYTSLCHHLYSLNKILNFESVFLDSIMSKQDRRRERNLLTTSFICLEIPLMVVI